jgi:hypothetical protein
MDSNGGQTDQLVRCPRDGVDTRLRCSECQSPICPTCLVRTAVGLRCPSCGAASGPRRSGGMGSRRRPALAAVAVATCVAVVGGAWMTTRDDGGAVEEAEEDASGERIVVPLMTLASGELPGGATWTLEARRDGGVCTTLKISVGRPPPERCLRSRSYRPVGNLLTVPVSGPAGPIYLTLGQVSDRTERVRIAPDGVPPWEIATVGADTGLEVRFFVMHMEVRAHTAITALASDGTTLGRVERPKPPAPRAG